MLFTHVNTARIFGGEHAATEFTRVGDGRVLEVFGLQVTEHLVSAGRRKLANVTEKARWL